MRIAVVGLGATASEMIYWSEERLKGSDDIAGGGNFSVELESKDYMSNNSYELVVFLLLAEEYLACSELVDCISTLQEKDRDFEVFIVVEAEVDSSRNNYFEVKTLCPNSMVIKVTNEWHARWGFDPGCCSRYVVPIINMFLASKRRLYYMSLGEERRIILGETR